MRGSRGAKAVKPVMYHYVRPGAEGLPNFAYLSLPDFERQLDHFQSSYGFVDREAFVRWTNGDRAPGGVLLTFDDGLRDHAEFVLPALRKRGLFGLFYVSSGPATTGRFLDVHRVHLALGRLGSDATLAWLKSQFPEHLQAEDGAGRPRRPTRIRAPMRPPNTSSGFSIGASPLEARKVVLDGLLEHAFAGAPPRWQDFYLDEQALRELSDAGMGVGPHSHTPRSLDQALARASAGRDQDLLGVCRTERGQPSMGLLLSLRCADQLSRRRPKKPWPKLAARSPSPSNRVTSQRHSPRRRVMRCLVTTAMPSRTARFPMELEPVR